MKPFITIILILFIGGCNNHKSNRNERVYSIYKYYINISDTVISTNNLQKIKFHTERLHMTFLLKYDSGKCFLFDSDKKSFTLFYDLSTASIHQVYQIKSIKIKLEDMSISKDNNYYIFSIDYGDNEWTMPPYYRDYLVFDNNGFTGFFSTLRNIGENDNQSIYLFLGTGCTIPILNDFTDTPSY